MASAMRQNEKNPLPTQVGSETSVRIGHEWPATRGRWNQGHLALLKSAGLPADFIFGARLDWQLSTDCGHIGNDAGSVDVPYQ